MLWCLESLVLTIVLGAGSGVTTNTTKKISRLTSSCRTVMGTACASSPSSSVRRRTSSRMDTYCSRHKMKIRKNKRSRGLKQLKRQAKRAKQGVEFQSASNNQFDALHLPTFYVYGTAQTGGDTSFCSKRMQPFDSGITFAFYIARPPFRGFQQRFSNTQQ